MGKSIGKVEKLTNLLFCSLFKIEFVTKAMFSIKLQENWDDKIGNISKI